MGTADIQHQLVINEHPHIIIAGEEELDGDFLFFPILISYYDLAVLCQRKVKLQFSTVTVVVLVDMIAYILVEGEETVAGFLTIYCITILGVFFFILICRAVKVIAAAFACILFQIQRRLAAIIVPILRYAFLGIVVCPRKNVALLKRERNIFVDLAQYSLCRVFSGQKCFIKVRFCQICSVQGRVMISVARIAYQALEGTRIKAMVIVSLTIYINVCIVDCHKRPIQIPRFFALVAPSIQAKISSNLAKMRLVYLIWLEMPCIQRILNLFLWYRLRVILVIIAQRAVKLLKFNKCSMCSSVLVIIFFTCFSVQLVVRVVVIQGTVDILHIVLRRKGAGIQLYYLSVLAINLLALFHVADCRFFAPIAIPIIAAVGNVIASVRIEARLFQISPCQRVRCTAIDIAARRRGCCIGELYFRVAFRDIYIPKVS